MSCSETISNRYKAIGIMSGTSHDGLDLCLADYSYQNGKWDYSIIKAQSIEYDNPTKKILVNAFNLSGSELAKLNAWYGKWIAARVNEFTADIIEPIDVIGSHGHTIFHNPRNGYTTQIGSGSHIAAGTGVSCVCDFRSGDVARGGQGAPLVPIGDELLFSNYDICINIGGIANLSYNQHDKRVAYDICPANMALNYLANLLSKPFDYNGELGKTGNIIPDLLDQLNQPEYYSIRGAKSLGREWFETVYQPILDSHNATPKDKLRTVYEHIATKIAEAFTANHNDSVLVTGGGAKNLYLVSLIKEKCLNRIVIPNTETVDYKEALIFGFLAILYLRKAPSSLASVTGASASSIGGCLYYP